MRRVSSARGLVLSAALFSFIACRHAPPAAPAKVPETPEQCTSRAHAFADFVAALPETAVASATRTDLAVATIGRAPGSGPVVEVSPRDLSIDGRPVPGDLAARAQSFRQWVTAWSAALPPSVKSATRQRPALYVAASADTDVHTLRAFVGSVPNSVELRLLVRVAEAPHGKGAADPGSRGGTLAARLLGESDPARASAIAAEGYAEFSKCAALSAAVRAVPAGPSRERWPNLRNAIASSLPSCACTDVDTDDLRSLVSAEQRAGVGSLAYLPLSFVRDERCDASMPLRSVEKLVKQLEQFDAEFSAQFQRDAVTFDDVLTSERLRVYFCDALPGETFAEKAHTRGTLYLHVPGTKSCEAWTFSALAPGSPMGTAARAANGARPALAFHYWQGAEEIRWFGPADGKEASKPTDARDYPCEETFRLTGIDEESLKLGPLQWFFTEAACTAAESAVTSVSGCVAERAFPASPVDAH